MAWRRPVSGEYPSQRVRGRSDPEKARLDYNEDGQQSLSDEDHNFPPSSMRSARSNQPMLAQAFHNPRSRSSIMLRVPNSIMRWLCLGLACAMALFMVNLVRMSWNSDSALKVAFAKQKEIPKPALWEEFPFLKRYYGGIRSLVSRSQSVPEYPGETGEREQVTVTEEEAPHNEKRTVIETVVFDPYPNYTSIEYIREYGDKVDCFLDKADTVQIPRVRMYEAIPQGFPDAVMGSADMLGIQNNVCFDRFGRLGPYGLGYGLNRGGSGAMQEGEREGADAVWSKYPEVDFRAVKWAEVQERCLRANVHRFRQAETPLAERWRTGQSEPVAKTANKEEPSNVEASGIQKDAKAQTGKSKVARNVVVIRTWSDYPYTVEDLIYLRALISELSVLSGAEYTIHFLIQVKDDNLPIWSDKETHDRVLRDALPEEFRGMGTLWTERQMGLLYGGLEESWMRDLPVHGVYRSTFMPMQYFAYQHPEYDFFWNWEMDVRNTGHWYHFFDSVTTWAKKQPRKYLWERNSRFYVPIEHGSWDDFSHMVRIQTEHGTNSVNNIWSGLGASRGKVNEPTTGISGDRPIWGPERPIDENTKFEGDPEPPTTMDKDKYEWGVGEDADLITFNPLFDPEGTTWLLRDDTTGYKLDEGRRPPRRTATITASRLSRKLLLTMHRETSINRHTMFSEMWPASCALHHGLKAVYAPHPMYIDRRWPTKYLQSVFNAGRNGATGAARTSVFGEPEHNFRGTTWYYNAGFPESLWHRWIGLKIHNDGGELWEMEGEGRMCLPPIMLHPVKRVELPQEGRRDD